MRRPALSIRAKVALASALLLGIPYVGYRYVGEMERYLREGLEQSVLGGARAVAGALHDRRDLLGDTLGTPAEGDLYVHPLPHPIQVDGYVTDWEEYLHLATELRRHPPDSRADGTPFATVLVGRNEHHLYLLIRVDDQRVIYGTPDIPGRGRGDHVRLVAVDEGARRRVFVLSTPSPGWVAVYEAVPGSPLPGGLHPAQRLRRPEPRVRAAWQADATGYIVEIRAPLSLVSQRLGVEVLDVDDPGAPGPVGFASSAGGADPGGTGRLLLPAPGIENLLRGLGRTPGRRVWIIDRAGRVLARRGDLLPRGKAPQINPLFALLLAPPDTEPLEREPEKARLTGPIVEGALAGEPGIRWSRIEAGGLYRVAGAHPVMDGAEVVGAVLVEETSFGVETARRQALAGLFNDTLIVFGTGALVLALLATRIGTRLRRLRDETEAAIDRHGRVVGEVSGSEAGDEIGDLARSFSTLMGRLSQYNDYLENLARRLSHELRTPIAVTRSSLEALSLDPAGPDAPTYLARARDGIVRLERILARMSEANRLEHALQGTERERFDLARVASASVAGYRTLWGDLGLEYRGPRDGVEVEGSPDLLEQLLDKLVVNAREFGRPGAPVEVALDASRDVATLAVRNVGPRLPPAAGSGLFEPMVSIREASSRAQEPHLGLGLYVVRLIAEFHGGQAWAEDTADGVRVGVTIPLLGPTPRTSPAATGSRAPPRSALRGSAPRSGRGVPGDESAART